MKSTNFAAIKHLWRLALPITASQLLLSANGIVDTLMVGRYGTDHLAGVAIGSGIWLPVLLLIVGLVTAISPLAGFQIGRNDWNKARVVVVQGIWCGFGFGLLGTLALLQSNVFLGLETWRIQPALATLTYDYVFWVSFGMPAVALSTATRTWLECAGFPRLGTYGTMFNLAMNILLNAILIHGIGPIPAMGARGCGMATAISMWLGCAFNILVLVQSKTMEHILFSEWLRIDPPLIKRIIIIGLPIGVSLFVEVSAFTLISVLLASLGAPVVAANQIVFNVGSLLFTVPLGCSLANTVIASKHLGANRLDSLKQTAILGIANNISLSCITTAILVGLRHPIATLFSNDSSVTDLAASLFVWAGACQLFDCWQVMVNHLLRALKDTAIPLAIMFVVFWCCVLPLGWHLTYSYSMGAIGFWVSLLFGLGLASTLLTVRFGRKFSKLVTTTAKN